MPAPEGNLTPVQHEIMECVWRFGAPGAAIADIWREVSVSRDVGRTTVLNLVDRLEKRGWLRRQAGPGANRFVAALPREQTAAWLAGEFVDDFFGGSASNLVQSLLGSQRLNAAEIVRLQKLLAEKGAERPARRSARKEQEP